MEEMGLKFILGAQSKLVKESGHTKIVELKDGNIVESNFILVSAGIKPNITLAQEAGIAANKGIIVNDRMETNITNIYAAGDGVEYNGRTYGIWPAAQRQGVIAGINISGRKEVYKGTVPSTTLKVAGIHLTSMGDIAADPSKNIYKKLFLKDGKIVGAILLGETKNAAEITQLMENKTDVSKYKEKILDTMSDFRNLSK